MNLWETFRKYAPVALRAWQNKDRFVSIWKKIEPAMPHLNEAYNVVQPHLPDIVGEARQLAMILWPELRESIGSSGPLVIFTTTWVQEKLNAVEGTKLDVDSDYGDETEAAVKRFQERMVRERREGWVPKDVDGVAGTKTCFALWEDAQKHPERLVPRHGTSRP